MAFLKAAILKVQANLAKKEESLKLLMTETPKALPAKPRSLIFQVAKSKRKP